MRLPSSILNFVVIVFSVISFIFITSTIPLYSYPNLKIDKNHYHPEITDTEVFPDSPAVNSIVEIYVRVLDKYGQIEEALLNYTNDQGNFSKKMKLINGIPSNGTFLGILNTGSKVNNTIKWSAYFKDNLNYSVSSSFDDFEIDVIEKDIKFYHVNTMLPNKSIYLFTGIKDFNGVKNATLYYITGINLPEVPPNLPKNITEKMLDILPEYYNLKKYNKITMNEYKRKDNFSAVFDVTIPPLKENTSLWYYGEYQDYKGYKKRSSLNGMYSITDLDPEIQYLLNKIKFKVKTTEINLNDLSSNLEISIDGKTINSTSVNSNDTDKNKSEKNSFKTFIKVQNKDNDELYNEFSIPLEVDQSGEDILENAHLFIQNKSIPIPSLTLIGDRSKFPFDKYYLNLTFIIPIENSTSIYENSFEPSINASWNPSVFVFPGYKYGIQYNLNSCKLQEDYVLSLFGGTTCNELSSEEYKPSTLSSILLTFDRNYSISIIIIPILAIFFLLGAIFIFENSSDNIGNRLTLTLGIFALIFTLPDIINSMKPQTSAPTIADSMLSIIIIATIAFTISSIISSSSTIQKWFPKHHTWIDGIVFVIVAGFVIAYFKNYLFDNEIWWLVPTIIFGLGYGLLLRTLGIKINKPLLHFLKVTKKKDI